MAGTDLTAAAPYIKNHYTTDKIKALTYPGKPSFAMFEKRDIFDGDVMPLIFRYGNGQAASSTDSVAFAGAQSQSDSYSRMNLVRGREYAAVYLDRETLLATKNKTGAFVSSFTAATDGALDQMARRINIGAYRDGTGAIGQIDPSTTLASTSLKLKDLKSVTCFEKNQNIVLCGTATGTPRGGGNGTPLQITAVNRNTGVLTLSGNINTIAGAALSDFIFILGDALNGATLGKRKLIGFQGWIPDSDPTAGDSFLGIDRSADPVRLAGNRYDATLSGANILESLDTLASQIAENGGTPNLCFLNYPNWLQFKLLMNAKGMLEYGEVKDETGTLGFQSIRLAGPNSYIDIVTDSACPPKRAYMLQKDTWDYRSLGDMTGLVNDDSLSMLRDVSLDGFSLRYASYFQFVCDAPAWNGVALLNT